MANKTVTVRPSGGDYTSLQAAITGEVTANANLVTNEMILTISIEGDWSGGADTAAVNVTGFTTSADYYLQIVADSNNEALKTGWDNNRYRLSFGGYGSALLISSGNVTILGLQIETNRVGTGYLNTIYHNTPNGDITVVKNCRVRLNPSSSNGDRYYACAQNYTVGYSRTIVFENCIVENYKGGTLGSDIGLQIVTTWICKIINCVVHNCTTGISMPANTMIATNTASFNNTDDFLGNHTINYCASDDGDGTNAVSPSGSDWDNEFADPANGDFTLLNTGNLYDAGIGPSSDANVPTTDIDGDTRSGATCDIGADEYTSGGGGTALPAIMAYYRRLRQ